MLTLKRALHFVVALGAAFGAAAAVAQSPFGSDDLIAKAKKEGAVVLYTANQLESEQLLSKGFNARFPEIKVEIVRAPGSQLIARIDAESAGGKLRADVIEFSDGGLASKYLAQFDSYAPPNAADYPDSARIGGKLWPKTTWGYVLSYNPALVKNPPKSWRDLIDAGFDQKLGLIPAGAGGTTWSLAMFHRQVLGEAYWKALAQKKYTFFASDAPLASAVVRGEVTVAPLKSNSIIPMMREGAPIRIVYPEDGVSITVSAAGIPRTSPNPNAARLFLNWVLSREGQDVWVETSGGFSMLKGAKMPAGAEKLNLKLWVPDVKEYASLREAWITEWNLLYNYRQ
jgi:iron(III) transport system substrate-binding protein